MACVCGPGRRPPRRLPLPAGDWRPLPPLQLPRFGAAACVLDGRPVVVGGVGLEGVTAKAERYNAAQGVPRAAAVPQHSAFFLRSCCLPMHASLSAPPQKCTGCVGTYRRTAEGVHFSWALIGIHPPCLKRGLFCMKYQLLFVLFSF